MSLASCKPVSCFCIEGREEVAWYLNLALLPHREDASEAPFMSPKREAPPDGFPQEPRVPQGQPARAGRSQVEWFMAALKEISVPLGW